MRPELYPVPCPWPGTLAFGPRPRGGDWLPDEMTGYRAAGITTVVSLLTPAEEADLDLRDEARQCAEAGLRFVSLPVHDRSVPESFAAVAEVARTLAQQLAAGEGVYIHCRQGIGRAAVLAACVLIAGGQDVTAVCQALGAARGVPVPETAAQRAWLDDFARRLRNPPPSV